MGDIRHYILILFIVSSAGLLAELYLLGHYEDEWQLVPVGLLLLGLLVGLITFLTKGNSGRIALRILSPVMVISAILGTFLHFRGNQEFELEMYPDLSGWELIWESLTGATPALSPAAMFFVGALGWIYIQIPKK